MFFNCAIAFYSYKEKYLETQNKLLFITTTFFLAVGLITSNNLAQNRQHQL